MSAYEAFQLLDLLSHGYENILKLLMKQIHVRLNNGLCKLKTSTGKNIIQHHISLL